MNRNDVGGHVADRTATNKLRDLAAFDGHHRKCGSRRQPERLVVTTGVVADVVKVAEHERHRAEALQARAGGPCVTANTSQRSTAASNRTLYSPINATDERN